MRLCARPRPVCVRALVDTRGSNDGLQFHGCIGKNHLLIVPPSTAHCARRTRKTHFESRSEIALFYNVCFFIQ